MEGLVGVLSGMGGWGVSPGLIVGRRRYERYWLITHGVLENGLGYGRNPLITVGETHNPPS